MSFGVLWQRRTRHGYPVPEAADLRRSSPCANRCSGDVRVGSIRQLLGQLHNDTLKVPSGGADWPWEVSALSAMLFPVAVGNPSMVAVSGADTEVKESA